MDETELKQNRRNLSVDIPYYALLGRISGVTRRPMIEEVRLMIDRRAEEVGLEPIIPTRSRNPAIMRSLKGEE